MSDSPMTVQEAIDWHVERLQGAYHDEAEQATDENLIRQFDNTPLDVDEAYRKLELALKDVAHAIAHDNAITREINKRNLLGQDA